jgi:prepilin-type processing-associated H-X9-DG protein
MDLRDIKTLKGIINELQGYLERHIEADNELFSKLKDLVFLRKDATELEQKFDKIHKTIKADLEKAFAMAQESEKRIQEGKLSAREINLIFPYLLSYERLLYQSKKGLIIQFGLKSEYDLLSDFLHETEKKGFDKTVLELIKAHISYYHEMSINERMVTVQRMKERLSEKVKTHFKIKRKMIIFNRPEINDIIAIGHARVHLNIYFDKDLTDKDIGESLENYINALSASAESYLAQNHNPEIARISFIIEQKARHLADRNLKDIEELWLHQLKIMFTDILSKNQDLIITPSFQYQVRIKKNEGNIAYCDGHSRIDHYLFGLEIGTLICSYLICDNFYEAIPKSIFSSLQGLVARQIADVKGSVAKFYGPISMTLQRMEQAIQYYRTLSLYSIYAHETEHAIDRKYLFKLDKLRPLLEHMIMKSEFYKEHETLNLGSGLLNLMIFYLSCRQEAPTQIREFIVNHEDNIGKNRAYSLINPIPALAGKNLIQDMNNIIKKLENNSDIDVSGFEYGFSHLINMTIFFADCLKNKIDLVMLDNKSMSKLTSIFPKAAPMMNGFSRMNNIGEGTPEWFLLKSVREGTDNQFIEILKRNNIPRFSIGKIHLLIHNNIEFYVFRPPVSVMKTTLAKIQKSDEVTYFDMYENACNTLKIPESDRLLSVKRIKDLAEKLSEANDILIKRAGFHS